MDACIEMYMYVHIERVREEAINVEKERSTGEKQQNGECRAKNFMSFDKHSIWEYEHSAD